MKTIKIYFIFSLALSLSSCGLVKAFQGNPKSTNELSVIRAHGAFIEKVNGTKIASTATGVMVLPGNNEVEITIDPTFFNADDVKRLPYTIIVETKPGTEYIITGQRGVGKVCAWPLNPETGDPDFTQPSGCIKRK